MNHETILKECCFVSGGRGSGKSMLAMRIVDSLLRLGYQIKVIDGSLVWRRKSSMPLFVKVPKFESETTPQQYEKPTVWQKLKSVLTGKPNQITLERKQIS